MAATLEELQALRANLIAAIASGTYQVRDGEKMLTYQTTTEMRAALGVVNDEIEKLTPGSRRKRYLGTFTKGL